MKRITDKQVETARRSIFAAEYSFAPPDWEFPESASEALGVEVWELKMMEACNGFLGVFGHSNDEARDHAEDMAARIGDLIAKQIAAGNFAAPRIVSEGILNLQSGHSWRRPSGRARSPLRSIIILAFCILQWEFSIKRPSQSDVLDFLAKHGLELSRDVLSKHFNNLDLGRHAGDAREALSQAGKRRSKKA